MFFKNSIHYSRSLNTAYGKIPFLVLNLRLKENYIDQMLQNSGPNLTHSMFSQAHKKIVFNFQTNNQKSGQFTFKIPFKFRFLLLLGNHRSWPHGAAPSAWQILAGPEKLLVLQMGRVPRDSILYNSLTPSCLPLRHHLPTWLLKAFGFVIFDDNTRVTKTRYD